jgi:hypothetical protein
MRVGDKGDVREIEMFGLAKARDQSAEMSGIVKL